MPRKATDNRKIAHLSQAQLRILARSATAQVSKRFERYKDNPVFAGTRMRVLEASDPRLPHIYSTGILPLDVATNVGGIPSRRFTIFHGPESSLKSTVLLTTLAALQRAGGIAVFVDCEHKLNFRWAETVGLDTEALCYVVPKTIEAGFEAVEEYITALRHEGLGEEEVPILIGWDSLHAGRAARTIKAGYEGAGYSPEAAVYSNAIPLLVPLLDETSAGLIAISQVRMLMGASTYQPQTKIGVGKQVLHQASLIGVFKATRLKMAAGADVEVVWRKNHLANPFGKGVFRVYDGVGVDRAFSAWSACRAVGLGQTKGGVRLSLDSGEQRAKSERELLDLLAVTPALCEEAETMARVRIGQVMEVDKKAQAEGEAAIVPEADVDTADDNGLDAAPE